MAPAPYHPYSHHPDQGPYVVFPNHADQILSNCIHILGVSLITFCLARRTEHEQLLTRQGWLNLTWTRFCCLILFLDSWFFLAFSGVLINGVGLSYSLPVCSLGIYSCITFYALSKFIIYGFLTERVWIVWSAGKSTRRIHSQTYKVCASIIIAYSFIFVLLIIGRIYDIRSSDGSCEIGLRFFASIPLVTFDLIVNILLTALFIWPLYRDNINNSRLRNVALRTLIAAGVALTTSSVNIAILAGLGGRQLGWVCLGSCSTDVTVNALVIYWVTAPAYRDHDVSNHNVNANNAANQNGNYDNDYHGQSIPSLRVPLTLLSIGAVLSEGPGMSPTVASPITPVTPVERDDEGRGQGQSGDKNKKGKWFGFGSGWRVGRSEDDDMLPRPVVAVYSKRKHSRENGWWRKWIVRDKTNEVAAKGLTSPLTPAGVDVSNGQGRAERAGEGGGGVEGSVLSERHSHPPGLVVRTDELEKGDMFKSGTLRPGEDEEEDEKAGFVLLVDSISESKEGEGEAGSSESSLPLRRVMTVPTPMSITRTISISRKKTTSKPRTPSLSSSLLSRSRSYLGLDNEDRKDEEEDRGEGSSSGITASARRRLGGDPNDCRVGSETSPLSLKRKRGERRNNVASTVTATTPTHGLHEQEETRRLTLQIPGSSLTRVPSRTSSSSSASVKAPRVMRSQSWDDELVNGWTRSQSRSRSRSRNSQLEDTFGTVNGTGIGRRALTVMVEHEVMRLGVEVLQSGPGWLRSGEDDTKSKQMVHPEHDNDTETETEARNHQIDFVHTKPPNPQSDINSIPRPISQQRQQRERPSFPVRSYSYNNANSKPKPNSGSDLGLGLRGGGGESGLGLGLGVGTQTLGPDQVHSRSLSVPLARLWIPPDGDGRGRGS